MMGQFFELCAKAGKSVCPIAERTARATSARLDRILAGLRAAPLAVPERLGGSVITEDDVLSWARIQLYSPLAGFPALGETLAALEARNASALATFFLQPPNVSLPPWAQANEALQAVACSDYPDLRNETVAQSKAVIRDATAVSRWAGPTMARVRLQCIPWDAAGLRPKSVFRGALASKRLAGKLLVASNTLDPVCPLADARSVTNRFAGARLLVQNAPGHTVTLTMSSCAAKEIGAFFQAGVLPKAGTVCQPDALPLVGAPGGKPA